ncbi:MAG: Hpt domain-containing protein [Chloroflexota bacterium]|nr:Hpt domain-containing protein [Chloroflexota bacterium]
MPDDVPIVDDRILAELIATTGDDIGFVRELVETYLADTAVQVDAMSAAVEADDAAGLVRPAHTLKSSSATVGAMRLSSVARDLEMAGRSGGLDPAARASLDAARTEWQAAADALAAWLERASVE